MTTGNVSGGEVSLPFIRDDLECAMFESRIADYLETTTCTLIATRAMYSLPQAPEVEGGQSALADRITGFSLTVQTEKGKALVSTDSAGKKIRVVQKPSIELIVDTF